MKIELLEVAGIAPALHAMRNPKNSWENSTPETDVHRSQQLTKAGPEHRKHLRMIKVWANITLPRFVWQEFDTYKHVDKISCSTMHTLVDHGLSEDDFEVGMTPAVIGHFNKKVALFKQGLITKAELKSYLPEGFLQKRTVCFDYETALLIYRQRHNHELWHWVNLCAWIYDLPEFAKLTGEVRR